MWCKSCRELHYISPEAILYKHYLANTGVNRRRCDRWCERPSYFIAIVTQAVNNSAKWRKACSLPQLQASTISEFVYSLFVWLSFFSLSFYRAKVGVTLAGPCYFSYSSHARSHTHLLILRDVCMSWLFLARKWTGVAGQKASAGGEREKEGRKEGENEKA